MLITLAIIAVGIGAGAIAAKCTPPSDGKSSSSDTSSDNDWGLAGQGNDPDFWTTYP